MSAALCAGWPGIRPGLTTLDDVEPDRQLLSLFPARILLKEELLPLKRVNGTVEVATSRLFATQGLDALKTMTGLNLKPVLASTEAIQREIKKRLGVGADTIGTLDEEKGFQVVDENAEDTNLDEAAEDEASIIRFVNQVLKDAIELRASDIHLEPFEDEFRIRYRIDGVLQEVPVPAQLKRFPAGHRFARQNFEPSQHRGKTPAAGRPHQGAH
jgi:type II secretory ATPase GspE/PulE/Tfp pilus assembly ATPase PilB-like protein